jgi:hypothetical protein
VLRRLLAESNVFSAFSVEREVLPAGQQRVFLALDVAPVAPRKAPIFALANVTHGSQALSRLEMPLWRPSPA